MDSETSQSVVEAHRRARAHRRVRRGSMMKSGSCCGDGCGDDGFRCGDECLCFDDGGPCCVGDGPCYDDARCGASTFDASLFLGVRKTVAAMSTGCESRDLRSPGSCFLHRAKKEWSLGVVLQIRPASHVDLMAWGAIDLEQSLIVVRYM